MYELENIDGVEYWWTKSKRGSKFSHPESHEQSMLVKWLKRENIKHHSVPNGLVIDQKNMNKAKREGLKAGVPDLFIYPEPGVLLIVEMKKSNGSLGSVAKDQTKWLNFLLGWGARCIVAYGYDAAKHAIRL